MRTILQGKLCRYFYILRPYKAEAENVRIWNESLYLQAY